MAAVQRHAEHFIAARLNQLEAARQAGCVAPLVTAPYDAELFGHWWFEGPEFLDGVARTAAKEGRLKLVTPTDHLQTMAELPVVQPAASSWGEGGDWRLWLNSSNAWIQEDLLKADRTMTRVLATCVAADELVERALRQMTRELLLAQASDWPFMQRTGTNRDFARGQVELRLSRFRLLETMLSTKKLDSAAITAIESETPIFPGPWPIRRRGSVFNDEEHRPNPELNQKRESLRRTGCLAGDHRPDGRGSLSGDLRISGFFRPLAFVVRHSPSRILLPIR